MKQNDLNEDIGQIMIMIMIMCSITLLVSFVLCLLLLFWRTRGRRAWLSTSHPSAPLRLVDKPHLPTALPPSSEITNAGP